MMNPNLNHSISFLEDINKNSSIISIINDLKENLMENKHQNGLIWEVVISIKIRENILYGVADCLRALMTPSFYEFNNFHLHYLLFPLYYLYRPINLIRRFKLFK